MVEKYVDEYSIYFWDSNKNKYIKYCSFTTLEAIKKKLELYIADSKRPYFKRSGWSLWRGNKPLSTEQLQNYKIEYKRYKVTKEIINEELIEENKNE